MNTTRYSGNTALKFAVICVAFSLVIGCGKSQEAAQPGPPKVTVGRPVKANLIEWDHFTGRLDAVETVEVRARVSGYLESVHFQEGAIVSKGTLLFDIDPRPFAAELERAKGEQARAEARLHLANLRLNRQRYLLQSASVSQDAYDERAAEERQAKADLQAAKAAVEAARLNVEFTQVKSPITGRISRVFVTEGNLITGGTGQATLLTTIVSLDPVYCYFDSDEQTYLKYERLSREGRRPNSPDSRIPVYLGRADEKGFPHEGHLDFVDNRIDPNTGTMRLRGIFPNGDHSLIPGLFARVRVPGSDILQAVLVPDEAIGSDQTNKFVYVVDEQGTVDRRQVRLGSSQQGLRVIRDGLSADERVIVKGIQRVRPGVNVQPQEEKITAKTEEWVPEEYEALLKGLGKADSSHPEGNDKCRKPSQYCDSRWTVPATHPGSRSKD